MDKKKTIEVAKIITNEERLYNRVKELEAQILGLNDSIQVNALRYQAALTKIRLLAGEISSYQQAINNLTEEQLALEKKRNSGRLYAYGLYSGVNAPVPSLDLGLNYSRPKVVYLLALDLITQNKPIIKAGVGLKIF